MTRRPGPAGTGGRRILVLLSLIAAGHSALAGAARAQGPEIAAITIEGNHRVETSLILSRFPLSVGDHYVPALVRQGVKDLYRLGLFDDITPLTETRGDGKVDLRIRVAERARISGIHFKGNKQIKADDLSERVVLTKGQLSDPAAVAAAERAIAAAYAEEGYPQAVVSSGVESFGDGGEVDVTFLISEGERVRLRAVRFDGNDSFDADQLRGEMKTKPKGFLRSGRFKQEQFAEDIKRVESFYRDRGFRNAEVAGYEVSYSPDRRDMFVDVDVEEGPRFTLEPPTWAGNEAVSDDLIAGLVTWKPGDPYSATKIGEMSAAITEAFTERGFLLGFGVREEETVLDGDRVAVHYLIQEGGPSRVGEIRITGNTRTKEKVIRRELSIFPGETFRRSKLLRSQRDVFALGYFDDVRVDFVPRGRGSDDIDIQLDVEERSTGTAGAGMGFSSATGLTGFLQIGHNNLFGNGWDVNLHLERGSRRNQYQFSFTEPWFLDRPVSLGFEVYDSEFSRDLFDEKLRGTGVTVGWRVPGLSYTRAYNSIHVEDVSFPFIDPGLSSDSAERLRDGEGTEVSTRFGVSRNTTDNPFYPTSGAQTSFSSEFTGGILGGSIDFHKYRLDHRAYFRPFWVPTIMVRTRAGALFPYTSGAGVPGRETFRLGGTLLDYLRGYDDYQVVPEGNVVIRSDGTRDRFPGGRYMLTVTAEYQFPVAHPLHGLLFLDSGGTWNDLNEFSLNEMRRGAGFGLRMEVPMLGILGLDYAYGFDRDDGAKWKAHLIFGQRF
jgi:outer membrane protein insertion porin family